MMMARIFRPEGAWGSLEFGPRAIIPGGLNSTRRTISHRAAGRGNPADSARSTPALVDVPGSPARARLFLRHAAPTTPSD